MRAAKKRSVDTDKILQDLVPLNALSSDRFNELSGKITIEVVKAGRYVFRRGDRDNRAVYLLEGKISLIDANRNITQELLAGTDACRHPIANHQPRQVSARVDKKAVIAHIDPRVLDVYLTWHQSNTADAVELDVEEAGDWMTRLLQSETFSKFPPSRLQALLMKMEPFPLEQGEVVIREGEEGDYFYTIHEGRCQVTRHGNNGSPEVVAELGPGDSFGEEALVSRVRRNATVTMLTDGQLMRLAKEDFDELLKTQLIRYADYRTAVEMVKRGAVWLDVRTADEYADESFEDSVNLPLADLRGELPELVFNATYIICCDTGLRSDSAAFLLSHKGYSVHVLKGGMAPVDLAGQAEDADRVSEVKPVESLEGADGGLDSPVEVASTDRASRRHDHGPGEAGPAPHETDKSLVAELEEERERNGRLNDQIELLRSELGESVEKLGGLYQRIDKHEETERQLQGKLSALQEGHATQLASLQRALEGEQQQNVILQEQSAADAARYQSLSDRTGNDAQALIAEKQRLAGELTAAQGRIAALERDLDQAGTAEAARQKAAEEAAATQQALEDEKTHVQAELTAAQGRITALEGELEQAGAVETARHQEVEEAAATQQALEDDRTRAQAELTAAQERIAALEKDLDQARAAETTRDQGAAEALDALRDENRGLAEKIESYEAAIAEHQAELDASTRSVEDSRREHDGQVSALKESLKKLDDELAGANATIEKLQEDNRTLLEAQQENAAHMQAEADSLDDLRQSVENEQQEKAELSAQLEAREEKHRKLMQQLADESAAVRMEMESKVAAIEAEMHALQVLLESEQQRLQASEQQLADRKRQVEALEQSTVAGDEARQALNAEKDLLRQQLDDALEMLQQREEHAKELEQEYAESLSKSHDELTRKNDTEKELQSQIDRLRKKLEQVSQDNRKSRESSLDDLDSLREELHLERQARAEERAQMAARQRELKEQLAAIATQHEANITDQSGAIEQAREEERSRLQSILDSHAGTEEQLARVQAELQQAHEEIAVLDQQEKSRRQTEIDALQEQKGQGEAAITQLEKQLKQLTHERDEAVSGQHELRVKMNALRGEVEVARGLMAAGSKGRVEDPEQLRAELEEARKNVAIAVRLRAEAEAAREKMTAEVHRLRAQYESEAETEQPLSIPSLDAFDPATGHMKGQGDDATLIPEPIVAAANAVKRPEERISSGRRPFLKAVMGMLALAAIGLVAWFVAGSDIQMYREPVDTAELPDSAQWSRPGTGQADVDAAVPANATPTPVTKAARDKDAGRYPVPAPRTDRPVQQGVAGETDTMAKNNAAQRPDTGTRRPRRTTPDIAMTMPATPAQLQTKPAGPVPVGRSFRDALRDGGKTPAMIELLAATFQMGSAGNSLNFDEGPRHTVSLRAFSISKREVTFAEYDRFARATGRRLPYDETWGRGKRPVINVSWHDAVAYTRWLSEQTGKKYRLPSEAEWEYAARAGSMYSFWWSDPNATGQANCFDCGSEWDGKKTAPVGSFSPNRFGLFDMAGNVQEWVADCYHAGYLGAPTDGAAWLTPNCTQRVVRGGAYSSPLDSLRSAKRGQLNQDTRLDNLGFRVVRVN